MIDFSLQGNYGFLFLTIDFCITERYSDTDAKTKAADAYEYIFRILTVL